MISLKKILNKLTNLVIFHNFLTIWKRTNHRECAFTKKKIIVSYLKVKGSNKFKFENVSYSNLDEVFDGS